MAGEEPMASHLMDVNAGNGDIEVDMRAWGGGPDGPDGPDGPAGPMPLVRGSRDHSAVQYTLCQPVHSHSPAGMPCRGNRPQATSHRARAIGHRPQPTGHGRQDVSSHATRMGKFRKVFRYAFGFDESA